MIYKVTIIDNGNQVSLTQQGNATPNLEGNPDDEARFIIEQALDKLMEVQDIDGED